jgi:DNA repair protein RecO (recombination protein O)
MLALPAFLQRGSGLRADASAVDDAFRLTGFFFARHVYEPRGLEEPGARAGFLAALRKQRAMPVTATGETAA